MTLSVPGVTVLTAEVSPSVSDAAGLPTGTVAL